MTGAPTLGVDASTVQLTLTSYVVGLAVGQVLWGPMTDRPRATTSVAAAVTFSARSGERVIGSPALRWDGPGLTRLGGAGLTLHSHLPAGAGLMVGSTSCHRATPGGVALRRECGEVTCRVDVAVDAQAARLALVYALRQGQLAA